MQELELVDRLFPDLMTGKKTHTLRWREGAVHPGYLLCVASVNPAWRALVWVTETRTAKLNELAAFYETTPQDLHASMKTHYPDIAEDSEVLLVTHLTPQETAARYGVPEGLKGKLIEKLEEL